MSALVGQDAVSSDKADDCRRAGVLIREFELFGFVAFLFFFLDLFDAADEAVFRDGALQAIDIMRLQFIQIVDAHDNAGIRAIAGAGGQKGDAGAVGPDDTARGVGRLGAGG